MKKALRFILFGILGFFGLSILVSVLFMVWAIWIEKKNPSPPKAPRPIGVLVGGDLIKSDTLYSQEKLGDITSIEILEYDTLATQILLVGEKGASIINEKGQELKHVQFKYGEEYGRFGLGNVQAMFRDDKITYLNRGGGWSPVTLLNERGETVWEYGVAKTKAAANDVAMIDGDADGEDELIVGTNGGGGLLAFEKSGKKIWKKDASNVFSVGVFKENGEENIIHTDGGSLVIRRANGKQIRKLDVPISVFEIDKFKGDEAIIGEYKQQTYVYDFYGKELAVFSLKSYSVDVRYLESDMLSIEKKGSVISNNMGRSSSELYFYNPNDSIVYQENYWGRHPAIKEYTSGSEVRLLLGCGDGTLKVYTKK